MFSKKPPVAQPVLTAPRGRGLLAIPRQHPYLSAGGAGFAGLVMVTALVLTLGDPNDATPRVRVPLHHAGAALPAGWRQALSPEAAEAPVTLDSLKFNEDVAMAGADAGMGGQATITFPGAAGQGLPAAPIAGLSQPGPGGPLPVIAADGRTAAQAYARPYRDTGKPRVALIIGGLGLNAKTTREAIDKLPPQVTLSFVPYAEGLQGWIDLARAGGHEVLLEAPMEPIDYPDNDPGPYTLMAADPAPETARRLEWLLSRASGYFGVTNYLGGRFLTSDKGLAAFMGVMRQRGLAFIDDGTAAKRSGGGAPRASADRIVDDQLDADAIDKQLLALEASAVRNGQALGSGFAYPLTLEQVAQWASGLEQRGYSLAPASAVMTRR
jgi:polysaccharide deacetylase 2 family uncharacterized protein YibQ